MEAKDYLVVAEDARTLKANKESTTAQLVSRLYNVLKRASDTRRRVKRMDDLDSLVTDICASKSENVKFQYGDTITLIRRFASEGSFEKAFVKDKGRKRRRLAKERRPDEHGLDVRRCHSWLNWKGILRDKSQKFRTQRRLSQRRRDAKHWGAIWIELVILCAVYVLAD